MSLARRWWRAPLAAALVAGAVLLAVESHALATAGAANERDAARSLLVVSGANPHGAPSEIGAREQALLGLEGTSDLRRAVDAIAEKRGAKNRRVRARSQRAAERILREVIRGEGPANVRSQAANLLGVLVLRGSMSSGAPAGMTKAAKLFRRAIVLAPENESAKFNLELVLSLPKSNDRSKASKKTSAGVGAGTDRPGSGY